MSIFSDLRTLAFLRRIARSLESLAESQKELAGAVRSRRLQREARAARRPRKLEMGTMDLKAAEARHRAQFPQIDEPEDAA